MKTIIAILALLPVACFGQLVARKPPTITPTIYTIQQPTAYYFGGILLSDNYSQSAFAVPRGVQLQLRRDEQTVTVGDGADFERSASITWCNPLTATSMCYGDIHLTLGDAAGHGLINADYRRVENAGDGPSIARKTGVRGSPTQWAVWAEQINLGPGSKAALWISGDNPEIEGRGTDTTANVIVINSNLHVANASIQRNAPAGDSSAVIRVFNGTALVAELLENGALRVKSIEILP